MSDIIVFNDSPVPNEMFSMWLEIIDNLRFKNIEIVDQTAKIGRNTELVIEDFLVECPTEWDPLPFGLRDEDISIRKMTLFVGDKKLSVGTDCSRQFIETDKFIQRKTVGVSQDMVLGGDFYSHMTELRNKLILFASKP